MERASRAAASWATDYLPRGGWAALPCRSADHIFDYFDALKSRTRSICQPRLRGGRRTGGTAGPSPAAGARGGGCDRATGHGVCLRQQDDHQTQGADPAPAVRGAGAGRHRIENHCPRENIRAVQGRVVQVLRRRPSRANASCWKQKGKKDPKTKIGLVGCHRKAFVAALMPMRRGQRQK